MEELREIAKAYLAVASNDIKESSKNFFRAMDSNSDTKVSLHEFLEFMRQERYRELRSSDLFKKLCRRNSKDLEFEDVMTLYYVIQSGRPFCNGCDEFIKCTYLCCIECFHSSQRNYCLCIKCYKDKRYSHRHDQFLDNFTLLEVKRREALRRPARSNQASSSRTKPSDQKNDGNDSRAVVPANAAGKTHQASSSRTKPSDNDGNDSRALVPAKPARKTDQEKKRKMKRDALIAFEKVLAIGCHAAVARCAIM
ncbi:hypothetical protein CRYUN_Cryun10bG0025800 [Craigia yunnanensis]